MGTLQLGFLKQIEVGCASRSASFFPPPCFTDFFLVDLIGLVLEPATMYKMTAMIPLSRAVSVNSALLGPPPPPPEGAD